MSIEPRQRVRVPMPVQTPMTTEDGLVSIPWLYYLMRPPTEEAGIPFDSKSVVLAACDPLEVGTDIQIHIPIGTPGRVFRVVVEAKIPPDDGPAIIDVLRRSKDAVDPTDYNSIFPDLLEDKIVLLPGKQIAYEFTSFEPDEADFEIKDSLRFDCHRGGGATQYVVVTVYWRPVDAEAVPGSLDGSQAQLPGITLTQQTPLAATVV